MGCLSSPFKRHPIPRIPPARCSLLPSSFACSLHKSNFSVCNWKIMEVLEDHTCDQGLICRIYQELGPNNKKTSNQIKMGKRSEQTFIQMANNRTWKDGQRLWLLKKIPRVSLTHTPPHGKGCAPWGSQSHTEKPESIMHSQRQTNICLDGEDNSNLSSCTPSPHGIIDLPAILSKRLKPSSLS